jgi:hypothetical protein
MEVIGGLVSGSYLLLSLVIGVRLLRLSRRTGGGPELWLGLFFLVASFLGMGLAYLVYMSWADAALALPEPIGSVCNAGYLFGTTAGMGCLYVFTWLTFRPRERWARVLVAAVLTTMLVGYLAIGFTDGYRLRLAPGVAYWITWAARTSVFLWLLIEAFRYWGLLRRRLRLGLAEPLLTNRFLLWGIWASAVLLTGLIDPVTRFWYVRAYGASGELVPEMGQPVVLGMVIASAALMIPAMTTLYLTFFPTEGYRRWVEARSASLLSREGRGVGES